MGDQAADANLVEEDLLEKILEEAPNAKITRFEAVQLYPKVTGESCSACSKKGTSDLFLKVRHGSILKLRKVDWKFSKETVSVPIIGRRVFKSVDWEKKEILMAVRDKCKEDNDVAHKLPIDRNEEESSVNKAALFGSQVSIT